jgi:Predicted membrane protein (DUF2254)
VIRRTRPEAQWLGEAVRTNLWMVPAAEVFAATLLFLTTRALDARVCNEHLVLPGWVISGSADGARQVLTTLAAALITVVGVVFSIILVASMIQLPQVIQRHVHRAHLHRLAGREPVPDRGRVGSGPGVPRRERPGPADHHAGLLRPAGRAGAREDPPGQCRHAGGDDPLARRPGQDHPGGRASGPPRRAAASCVSRLKRPDAVLGRAHRRSPAPPTPPEARTARRSTPPTHLDVPTHRPAASARSTHCRARQHGAH